GVRDIETLLVQPSCGPTHPSTFADIPLQLLQQIYEGFHVPYRHQRERARFPPEGLSQMPSGRDDWFSMAQANHNAGTATAHAIGIRLDKQITRSHVAREIFRSERTSGLNPSGKRRHFPDQLLPELFASNPHQQHNLV